MRPESRDPLAVFLVRGDRRTTYADFAKAQQRLAGELAAVAPTPRVFQLESDYTEATVLRFLTLLGQGHTVLMSPAWHFHDAVFTQRLSQEAQTDFVRWPLDKELGELDYTGGRVHPEIERRHGSGSGLFLVRTSGTSGKAFKLILHDPQNFVAKYQRVGPHFQRTLAFSPLDSIAGIETVLETFVHGLQLVLLDARPGPQSVMATLAQHEVDYFQTTPSFLGLLMVAGLLQRAAPVGLRRIAYGSEPAQAKVLACLQAHWPAVELVQTYGMSEVGILKTIPSPHDPTLFLLDETFNPGRLTAGALEVRSLTPLLCYLNVELPAAGSTWFETHDRVGVRDGYWQVLGREGDLINIAGRKFFPAELEELLMRLPEVLDATVSAEADELIGTAISARLVVATTITEIDFRKKLKSFLETDVPYFMRPQRVALSFESSATSRFKKSRRPE